MALRASWSGFIKLSLVSVPVKAYTATVSGGGEIHLRQLHEECHSPIKYRKTCPIHDEVPNEQIVSGYEYAKGQFVVVNPDELDQLRSESDKAITIDAFIKPDAIAPLYFSGRTYYLAPDGPVGQKPYALLHRGMSEENRHAFGHVVFSGREQMVLVRPLDCVLAMLMLTYDQQLKKPSAFADEVGQPEITAEELRLAKTLIQASTAEDLDLAQYKDTYTDKLTEIIAAKVEGKQIVVPPPAKEPEVINLMDALRQSVAWAQEAAGQRAKPGKKMALGASEETTRRKRKKA